MDKTPKPSKSLRTFRNQLPGTSNESVLCSTPKNQTRMFTESENEESPVHIACTQEGYDNVDVVWDWNSPRAKQPKRTKKRLILPQSPKVPMKRHSSNNNIQNFEKLREELQALREAIAVPDNEESLVLSPVEEAKYKYVTEDQNMNDAPPSTQEIYFNDDDVFNDSADEDLILCTQKIEAELEAKQCNNNKMVKTNSNLNSVKKFNGEQDCFDTVLKNERLQSDKVTENYNGSTKTSTGFSFTRTLSENQCKSNRQAGKVEFHRTQSFESTVEYTKVIPRDKMEEIERKRKEALAKLEAKRRQEHSESPSKCSPEEIERKRLQALAKLEAKRQQEIIERKRQEALKRLEMSRKKNVSVVKSSLCKRL